MQNFCVVLISIQVHLEIFLYALDGNSGDDGYDGCNGCNGRNCCTRYVNEGCGYDIRQAEIYAGTTYLSCLPCI